MIVSTLLSVLFIFPPTNVPQGSVTEGPRSIRSFQPDSTELDNALETYFQEAGPLAIEMYEHISLLSNPWLGGRKPGTDGSNIAGNYIVWNFEQSNLKPAFDEGSSWYQPFTYTSRSSQSVLINSFVGIEDMALVEERDYVVFGNSGSGHVSAPITFVGYAIESGEEGYSSFDEFTDLTGQIALMLRYEPLDEDGASQWARTRFSPNSNIRDKMQAVIDRGAVGVILVNPPNCRDGRRGLDVRRSNRMGSTDIPIVQFSEDAANLALPLMEFNLSELQMLADSGDVTTLPLMQSATLTTEIEMSSVHARNIGGVLVGKGDLADEWVVIGGHYDHLGYGSRGRGELHPGADDNASGTAAVMILARIFSQQYQTTDDASLRSVLFLLFDSEELGLLGSAHFVENPIMDLEQVNAMINLDMVGNLRNNKLSISGSGTAEEFETLVPQLVIASGLDASLTRGGTGPSDHANFFRKDIPILFFFTGITDEYHSPEDKAFKTNPAGAALIIDLVREFATLLINDPKLTFTSNTAGGAGQTARMPSPVRLGIQPSYSALLETGIMIASVSEGTCAEDAGLIADDVLLAWNDSELVGGRSLMEMLRASKPGDVITFTVQRDGKNIKVEVTLRAP